MEIKKELEYLINELEYDNFNFVENCYGVKKERTINDKLETIRNSLYLLLSEKIPEKD